MSDNIHCCYCGKTKTSEKEVILKVNNEPETWACHPGCGIVFVSNKIAISSIAGKGEAKVGKLVLVGNSFLLTIQGPTEQLTYSKNYVTLTQKDAPKDIAGLLDSTLSAEEEVDKNNDN